MAADDVAMHDEAKAKTFRILSIEGGGILGAFAAGALAEIERSTERRIVDHFDLIAGTSTGGIIAIGLAMGIPAARISEFYINHGRDIFPHISYFGRRFAVLRHLVRPKYVTGRLQTLLEEILVDDAGKSFLLGDAKTRLIVPAYDALSGRIYLFKTAHGPRFIHDIAIPAARVALATAAAPTYFKAMRIEEHRASYVDGGVWANSPALSAVVEANVFLDVPVRSIRVLNVGTTSEAFNAIRKAGSGLFGWNRNIMSLFMMSQGEASRAMSHLLTGQNLTNVNYLSRNGEFSLDDASRVEDLVGLGRAEAAKRNVADVVEESFVNGYCVDPFIPERRI